jgi:hypothetical protein
MDGAVGDQQGCLDLTPVTANTWYHVYLIRNPTTGIVDIEASKTSTPGNGPSLPPGYTQFRRIGSLRTDASSNWVGITQNGDEFLYMATFNDAAGVATTTAARTFQQVTVPPNLPVQVGVVALMRIQMSGVAGSTCIFTSPYENDQAPNSAAAGVSARTTVANDAWAGHLSIRANNLRQVGVRSNNVALTVSISTYGYLDRRGKDG